MFEVVYSTSFFQEEICLNYFTNKMSARKFIAKLLRNEQYDVKVVKPGNTWRIMNIPTLDYGMLKLIQH